MPEYGRTDTCLWCQCAIHWSHRETWIHSFTLQMQCQASFHHATPTYFQGESDDD